MTRIGEETLDDVRQYKRRNRDRLLEFIRVFWPIIGAVGFVITTWAEIRAKVVQLDDRVKSVEVESSQVQAHTTAIAVLQTNVQSIKESVDDVKKNTEWIVRRLDRQPNQ